MGPTFIYSPCSNLEHIFEDYQLRNVLYRVTNSFRSLSVRLHNLHQLSLLTKANMWVCVLIEVINVDGCEVKDLSPSMRCAGSFSESETSFDVLAHRLFVGRERVMYAL